MGLHGCQARGPKAASEEERELGMQCKQAGPNRGGQRRRGRRPKRDAEARGTIPWRGLHPRAPTPRHPSGSAPGGAVQFKRSLGRPSSVARRSCWASRQSFPEGAAPRRGEPPPRRPGPARAGRTRRRATPTDRARRGGGLPGCSRVPRPAGIGGAHAASPRPAAAPGVSGDAGADRYAHSRALAWCNSASWTML